MARKHALPKMVRIRANVSFNEFRKGQELDAPLVAQVQGWLDAGFMRLLAVMEETDGQDPDRPGGLSADDPGGEPARADGGRKTRRQPRKDPSAG